METIKTKPDYRTYNTTTKTWVKLPRMDSDNEPDIKQMRDNWNANTYSLVHFTHDDPADGLISKPSQNGIYGLTTSYEAIGAGHLEQGNHVEVRRRLNDVFARIQNPEYFTPERQ